MNYNYNHENYSYEISNEHVRELINDERDVKWEISLLCKDSIDIFDDGFYPTVYFNSYNRTREWLINNYPEFFI
jgi:hypothetical protein